jgi:glycosyltransferase involved in cell wall biosynthesis
MANSKVAIVCDWLESTGGAERVVIELHHLYPNAPIYTSQVNPKFFKHLPDADIRTSWLQKLPIKLRKFLPMFRIWVFSRLDLSDYDIVISASGAEAKGVRTGENTKHLCYCHAPTHYYWSRHDEYLKNPGFGWFNPLARLGLRLFVKPLRIWDARAAQRPDMLLTNSTHTQALIQRYYKRESTVVYPPVDVEHFRLKSAVPRHGFVTAGRQTPYKRTDLAVEACSQLNIPLVVIGNGPEHRKLEKLAGRSVIFLTKVTDEEMVNHFQSALGFIFPSNVDDFGITPVEAMAAGTPVIALNKGGPLDYVLPNETGLFYDRQTVPALKLAINMLLTKSFDYKAISAHAEQFSTERFDKQIVAAVKQLTA